MSQPILLAGPAHGIDNFGVCDILHIVITSPAGRFFIRKIVEFVRLFYQVFTDTIEGMRIQNYERI